MKKTAQSAFPPSRFSAAELEERHARATRDALPLNVMGERLGILTQDLINEAMERFTGEELESLLSLLTAIKRRVDAGEHLPPTLAEAASVITFYSALN